MASATAQGLGLLSSLIIVPLTLGYLGAERYGLWMAISSAIAVLACVELGIGSGLLTLLAEAHGKDDRELARQYVSSSFFTLSGLAILTGVISLLVYPWIPWSALFNVTSAVAAAEIRPTVAVLLGSLLLMLPLVAVQRIYLGYQEGFVNSQWTAAGSLVGLAAVIVAIQLRAGLPWLALAVAAAPVVATCVNGVVLFTSSRPWLRPGWSHVGAATTKRLFKTGLLFFLLELATAVGSYSDNIIIAQLLGPEQVTQYAVPMKLFLTVLRIIGFVLAPLWPAYGEALARGDKSWVRSTFIRATVWSLAVTMPCALLLLICGGPLIHFWAGDQIAASFSLLAGFGLWIVLSSVARSMTTLLNGANVVRFQVICAVPMSVANVAGSIFLVRRIGVAGPIYASAIAQLVFIVLPYGLYLRKFLSLTRGR